MLVKTYEEYQELPMYDIKNPIPDCFLCGERVIPPLIVWSGTKDIQLHPDCAAHLVLALSRDLHEFKQSSGRHLEFVKPLSPGGYTWLGEDSEYPRYKVQLAKDEHHFIDIGTDTAHIKGSFGPSFCGFYFKQRSRILEVREMDYEDVCRHCLRYAKIYCVGQETFEEFKTRQEQRLKRK